ncbi:MAG: transposase, partial [Betaproteobacteria bacterium]|nr:transposase [Betaproteobacteria bacterium]
WSRGWLIAVPPHNTSRTCPDCGHVAPDTRRTQAQFKCVACGYANHADHVGAMNILARGHRVAACGEVAHSGPSAKQEPTEATARELTHA